MVLRINPEKKEERERIALSLLRAALELAAAHGFSSLGLREVARSAGIAPTSFYRHFSDMEALGLELIKNLGGSVVRLWVEEARAAAGESGLSVAALTEQVLASAAEDPALVRFLLAERVGPSQSFRTAIGQELSELGNALRSAVGRQSLLAEGTVSDAVVEAVMVLILEGCAQVLDRGAEHVPLASERVSVQVNALLGGATGSSSR